MNYIVSISKESLMIDFIVKKTTRIFYYYWITSKKYYVIHVYDDSITRLQRYEHDDVIFVISWKKKLYWFIFMMLSEANFKRYIFNIMEHNLWGFYLPA